MKKKYTFIQNMMFIIITGFVFSIHAAEAQTRFVKKPEPIQQYPYYQNNYDYCNGPNNYPNGNDFPSSQKQSRTYENLPQSKKIS